MKEPIVSPHGGRRVRRIVILSLTLVLVLVMSSAVVAQQQDAAGTNGSAPLSQADLDYYREVATDAMAEIDAEILVLQEAIDDPDTVALRTSSGPRIVHISHLPAALQLEALLLDRGSDDIPERLGLWARLDELGLLPESVYTPVSIAELIVGLDGQAELEIEALLAEKAEVELFLEWLEQEPIAATIGSDVPRLGDLASDEGPYLDRCVFRTGYPLDRSRFPVTQVVAWKRGDFDPTWARFEYAAATPDEEADDPSHRIEAMRRNVAAIDDATVVYDGSFSGFCGWADATCPGTDPLVGGEPVCEDGRPVTD